MRKLYALAIVMVCISSVSNAQISKGSTFLGGSVNFSSNSRKDDDLSSIENKTTNWGVTPQLGKAVATNKIVGVFLHYSTSKNQYYSQNSPGSSPILPTKSNSEGTDYGGGFFYRQYHPFSSRFYVFGQAGLGTTFGKQQSIQNDILTNEQKWTDFGLALTPGFSFAATRKLHLEASLGSLLSLNYNTSTIKEFTPAGDVSKTSKSQSFSANANTNGFSGISIGLRWILPSKK